MHYILLHYIRSEFQQVKSSKERTNYNSTNTKMESNETETENNNYAVSMLQVKIVIPSLNFRSIDPIPDIALQELCQRHGHQAPFYEVVKVEGTDHQPCFTVQVKVGLETAQGSGKRKKLAQKAAAKVSLNCFSSFIKFYHQSIPGSPGDLSSRPRPAEEEEEG